MGQKVNPIGFRLGIIKDSQSRWFSKREYAHLVLEDAAIRGLLGKRFARVGGDSRGRGRGRGRGREGDRGFDAGIGRVEIERAANNVRIAIHTAKPGIIIGRGGRGVDDLRSEIEKLTGKKVHINVQEIRTPELEAQLVAENVASQIERRVAFKRAIRQSMMRTMKVGAEGIKVIISGRLAGSELARTYSDKDGKIPLHTLRADVDYGFTEARTTYGHIGVKVWIYRGEILPGRKEPPHKPAEPEVEVTEKKTVGWRRAPEPARAAREEAASEEKEPSAQEQAAGEQAAGEQAAGEQAAQEEPTAGEEKSKSGTEVEPPSPWEEAPARESQEESPKDADAL